ARSLSTARQFDEPERLYRDLLKTHKELLDVHRELYRLLLFQGKIAVAEAVLKKAIDDNPKEFSLLLDLATHYYRERRRDDVVKVLERLKSNAKEFPQAWEQAGLFYFRLGDGAEAIRQFEEGIKSDSAQKVKYQKLIIEVLMAQGKKEEARKINDAILAANPKDSDAQGLQASMLLDKGELQAAINQLQSVVMNAPDNFVAHFNLGRALMERGDWEPARQRFTEAIRLKPDYIAARLALGQLQLTRREFDLAVKTANEALQFDRANAGARLVRSAANIGLNQLSSAREELNDLLKASPGNQDALFQLGLLNVIDRKYKDAEEAYRKCYDLNPGNSRGLMGQIETIMLQGQDERAMQVLRAETQKYPARLEFRVAMGNLAVRAKKLDLAIGEYRWLLDRVDKKSAMAGDSYFRLAEVYRMKNDLPSALEAMQKAKDVLPNNSTVLNSLAILLDALGRRQEAKTMYESTLRLEGENPIALNNLAFIMANSEGGDLDQALTYAQRAKQKRPQIAEISDTLGLIYLKKNLADNAIEIFKDCVAKVPKHPTYRYHLGMAYLQKGDKARAKTELQAALASKPLSKEEEEGIKELLARIG
ncbi:MAG: tetratricopeptide repeat protein, partial [Acidobacteria bacterium]|nr:tetratricopeptide repeat protein [Acidobacteriota bacterium]